ncbi:hypothetical protein ONZ45_g16798 [Pleurotus djamor]|nr:hypothetical protein ONZ45_g16798 [Pleurotus djamor]
MVASRAPDRDGTEETPERMLWFRCCAELLAHPNKYKDCCQKLGLNITRDEIVEPVHPPSWYTPVDAAREFARQGISVKAADDAQPYGFQWILHQSQSMSSIAQEMLVQVNTINQFSEATIDALFHYSPIVYQGQDCEKTAPN